MDISSSSSNLPRPTYTHTIEQLRDATNNFSESCKLGEGGNGKVYEGILDNRRVAIKRLNPNTPTVDDEVCIEIFSLVRSSCHHNIVNIFGYLVSEDEKIIVYDYVENKTLDYHLHGIGRMEGFLSTWKSRFKIILDIANALHTLHFGMYGGVCFHRDVKPSNILIDKEGNAILADFGIVLWKPLNEDYIIPFHEHIKGTPRYMAPETILGTESFSVMADVYSFGLVILEIISGFTFEDRREFIKNIMKILPKAYRGELTELLDVNMGILLPEEVEQVKRVMAVGAGCIRQYAATRPDMREVLAILKGECEPQKYLTEYLFRDPAEVQRENYEALLADKGD